MKKYLDITFGILLILYISIINIISDTKIAFSLPLLFSGTILVIYHFIKNTIERHKFLHKVFMTLKVLIIIGIVWLAGMEALIVSHPKHNMEKADYILVLGAGLANKTTPSMILQGRLNAAMSYLEQNKDAYIVLSGGQGSDEKVPESHAMSKYLEERGVDKNKIIIEAKSRDTNENFKYSKEKIEEHSNKPIGQVNVKIITTDFHAFRSSILAKKNGYANFSNYSSHTIWYLIPVTYTREAFAIVKSVLFD